MSGLGEEVGILIGRTRPGVFSFRSGGAGAFDSGGGVQGGGMVSWSLAGEDVSGAFLFLLAGAVSALGDLAAFGKFCKVLPLRSDTILAENEIVTL
jgi:hypothetical protein